jgi:hypothetical protein
VVAMRARTTFDSSKTPEAGAKVKTRGKGAAIDLQAYKVRLATLIEDQAANDPKALKARVAELEKQLAKGAKVPTVPSKGIERVVEKTIIPAATLTSIERLVGKHDKAIAGAATLADRAGAMMRKSAEMIAASSLRLEAELGKLRATIVDVTRTATITKPAATAPAPVRVNGHPPMVATAPPARARPASASTDASLKPAHLRILSAIAWWEGLGIAAPDFTGVAFVAGTSASSSSFENNRSRLRAAGYIDYAGAGRVQLTDAGRALAPAPALAATNDAIQAQVMGMIAPAHGRMLRAAIDAYPGEISYEDVAERAGASAASSSFENNRSWLRARGLIEYPRAGHVRATALLFPEGTP